MDPSVTGGDHPPTFSLVRPETSAVSRRLYVAAAADLNVERGREKLGMHAVKCRRQQAQMEASVKSEKVNICHFILV